MCAEKQENTRKEQRTGTSLGCEISPICSKRFSISLKYFDHQAVRETALGEMVTGKVDSS